MLRITAVRRAPARLRCLPAPTAARRHSGDLSCWSGSRPTARWRLKDGRRLRLAGLHAAGSGSDLLAPPRRFRSRSACSIRTARTAGAAFRRLSSRSPQGQGAAALAAAAPRHERALALVQAGEPRSALAGRCSGRCGGWGEGDASARARRRSRALRPRRGTRFHTRGRRPQRPLRQSVRAPTVQRVTALVQKRHLAAP